MAFPPEFLREVGERNRIEDVAASYVNLRRRGKNLVGLCPFHNEKTPPSSALAATRAGT